MAREDHQLKFRVPEGLKAKLEAHAEANKRSLNSEIIARLEDSLLSEQLTQVANESSIKPPTAKELKRLAEIIVILERNALDEKQSVDLEKHHEEVSRRPRNKPTR